jgi:HK97 family phage prohead protease
MIKFLVVHQRQMRPEPEAESYPVPIQQDPFTNVKRFEASMAVKVLEAFEGKSVSVIKDGAGNTVDYHNVTIEGYLSTFGDLENKDRQGEYVKRGAFSATLARFMERGGVMLRDHSNRVDGLVGKFIQMKEDEKGLHVVGLLSNAPDVQSVRFKVAEKILNTLSIGGVWTYDMDGRGISKVDLFEGSLTPVPANPDATFSTRSLTDSDKKFLLHRDVWPSYSAFAVAEQAVKTMRE